MNLEFETTEEMEDIFREGYYDFSKRIIDVTRKSRRYRRGSCIRNSS